MMVIDKRYFCNKPLFVVDEGVQTEKEIDDPQFVKIPKFSRPMQPQDLAGSVFTLLARKMVVCPNKYHRMYGLPVPLSDLEGELSWKCLDMPMEELSTYADVVTRHNTALFPEWTRTRTEFWIRQADAIPTAFPKWDYAMWKLSKGISTTLANAAWVAIHDKNEETRRRASQFCRWLMCNQKIFNRRGTVFSIFMTTWCVFFLLLAFYLMFMNKRLFTRPAGL